MKILEPQEQVQKRLDELRIQRESIESCKLLARQAAEKTTRYVHRKNYELLADAFCNQVTVIDEYSEMLRDLRDSYNDEIEGVTE